MVKIEVNEAVEPMSAHIPKVVEENTIGKWIVAK